MTGTIRRAAGILAAAVLAVAASLPAAPAPITTTDTFKDRQNFIPHRKYLPHPGKIVGLLVSDTQAKMAHDGRGGPPDAMGFSVDGSSYNWIYVPDQNTPIISNLQVKVGEKGDRIQVYPKLNMANPRTVLQWGIKVPYAIVEIEVNSGQGAPADEGFVATKMTRLDGTREMPIDVTKVIGEMKQKYATWKTDQQRQLDLAMTEAQKKALKDAKPTGPRETSELMYLTWMPETKHLQVRFRTMMTDGDYKTGGGGVDRVPPFALPPKPLKKQLQAAPPRGGLRPPPPRDFPGFRFGTQFGIEFGVAYEIDTAGKLVKTLLLPPEAFKNELPPPPGVGPGGIRGGIDRLPPRPVDRE